jgi:hypothetical protein
MAMHDNFSSFENMVQQDDNYLMKTILKQVILAVGL